MKLEDLKKLCDEAEDCDSPLTHPLGDPDLRTMVRKLIEAITRADEIYRLSERKTDVWNAYKAARKSLESE